MANESVQFVVHGNTVKGKPWQQTFPYWVTADSANAPKTLQDLLDTFVTHIGPGAGKLSGCLPQACTILGVTARNYLGSGYWPGNSNFTAVEGERPSGDVLPEGIGPCAVLRADPGPGPERKFTKLYFPAIAEADQENGAISDALITAIQGFFTNIFTLTNGPASAYLALISPTHNTQLEVRQVVVSDRLARLKKRGNTYQGRSS